MNNKECVIKTINKLLQNRIRNKTNFSILHSRKRYIKIKILKLKNKKVKKIHMILSL